MGRIYCLIAGLFLWFGSTAQNVEKKFNDTSKKIINRDAITLLNDEPLYVIDDNIVNTGLKGVDPNNVLAISVLKDVQATAIYGSRGANGVIIITTTSYAQRQYQKKFSTFSIKYKDYVEHHQNNDESINYIVNGVFFLVRSDQRIKNLYEIPANKIKTVDFMKNEFYNGGDSTPYIVVITTK